MKRTEYHEVYGWMPQDIINKLSQMDRNRLFIEFISRKPTPAGRYIVTAAIKELGEKFIHYMFSTTLEALQVDGEVTKDELKENIQALFESFATDLNVFQDYVDNYLEETGVQEGADPVEETVEPKKQMPERDSKGRFIKKK